MAKYSVGGTEVIDDSGLIDWSKITGTPSAGITDVAYLKDDIDPIRDKKIYGKKI